MHEHDQTSPPDGSGPPDADELPGGTSGGDPLLRADLVGLVTTMASTAGSNRRLHQQAGVSEATVRNFRQGRFPYSSVEMARRLDAWAVGALPDHPRPGAPGSLTEMLARWQGRSPDQLDLLEEPDRTGAGSTHPAGGGGRRSRVLVGALGALGVGVAVLAVAVALLARALLDDGSERSGTASVRVDRDLPLDDDNFCGWTLGSDPVPLVSADPLVMRVDARCNNPAEPDPVLDTGASLFDAPDNDTATKVGVLRSGNTFVPACWTTSADLVTDGATPPNGSPVWLRAEQPDGWLPVVNVGGGYTPEQLLDLGLARC